MNIKNVRKEYHSLNLKLKKITTYSKVRLEEIEPLIISS